MGSEELQAPIPGECVSPATSTPWGLGNLSSPLPSSPGLPAAATQGVRQEWLPRRPREPRDPKDEVHSSALQQPKAGCRTQGAWAWGRFPALPCPRRTVVAWSQEGPRLWSREGAGPHPNPVLPEGTN